MFLVTLAALARALFALGVTAVGDLGNVGWLQGLKIVAVAVVAQAVLGMAKNLPPDRARARLALGAAITVLLFPTFFIQVLVFLVTGLFGLLPVGLSLLRDTVGGSLLSLFDGCVALTGLG